MLEEVEAHKQPETPAEEREYLERLLVELGKLSECAQRYIYPAREQMARALQGRWEDEDDPDQERVDRVQGILS